MIRWPLLTLAYLLLLDAVWAVDNDDVMQPAADRAINRGLHFLASSQLRDGSWDSETGLTAPCILAFIANGQLPGRGKYGPVVARAIDYLINNVKSTGLLFSNGPDAMYHHGLATLALAEVWGQSHDVRLQPTLRHAIDLICSCQNSRGGWRYQPIVKDDDMSVTVMQLMALRAAQDAGIDVPKETIDAGLEYVKSCHKPRSQGMNGAFSYDPSKGYDSFAMTGAGVTSLQVAGDYKAEAITEGVNYIMLYSPVGKLHDRPDWHFYGLYYATMGIYQAQSIGAWGRQAWARWYPAVIKELVSTQSPDGHWDGGYAPNFTTGLGLVILSIPRRYLPVFQR
jgi:hypothetical protein